jgi:uncharacterized protein YjbI with pentapeptide repeats
MTETEAVFARLRDAVQRNDSEQWNSLTKTLEPNTAVTVQTNRPLDNFDFTRIVLENSKIEHSLSYCRLGEIRSCKFSSVDLFRCEFAAGFEMRDTTFTSVQLQDSVFSERVCIDVHFFKITATYSEKSAKKQRLLLFDKTSFLHCHFENSDLRHTYTHKAKFQESTIEYCNLSGIAIYGTHFDQQTRIRHCEVSENTLFLECELVGRVDGATLLALKQNLRRFKNRLYFSKRPFRSIPARLFWRVTRHGYAGPGWFAMCFLVVWIMFSQIYMTPYYLAESSHYETYALMGDDSAPYRDALRANVRSLYFSLIVMTTLGFGDVSANCGTDRLDIYVISHLVVGLQVLLGYMLLTAILARLTTLLQELPEV